MTSFTSSSMWTWWFLWRTWSHLRTCGRITSVKWRVRSLTCTKWAKWVSYYYVKRQKPLWGVCVCVCVFWGWFGVKCKALYLFLSSLSYGSKSHDNDPWFLEPSYIYLMSGSESLDFAPFIDLVNKYTT